MFMKMLWYSFEASGIYREYRLPDNESFFTVEQWRQYQELSEMATAYRTTVEISEKSRHP